MAKESMKNTSDKKGLMSQGNTAYWGKECIFSSKVSPDQTRL